PGEFVAFAQGDRDEARSADVRVLRKRRLLDEALARRHDQVLGRRTVAERDQRRDTLAGLHRFEDVLDWRALGGAARVRELEDLDGEDAAAIGEDVQAVVSAS